MSDKFDGSSADHENGRAPESSGEFAALIEHLEAQRPPQLDPLTAERIWHHIVAGIDELEVAEHLRQHQSELPPRPSVRTVKRIWRHVSLDIQESAETSPTGFPLRSMAWRAVAILACILFIVLFGIANTANADVLPGMPLYPIKRAVESVQLRLAPEETRNNLRLAIVERRQDELNRLVALNAEPEVVAETLEDMLGVLKQVAAASTTAEVEQRAHQLAQVEQNARELTQTIQQWPETYQQPAQPAIQQWYKEKRGQDTDHTAVAEATESSPLGQLDGLPGSSQQEEVPIATSPTSTPPTPNVLPETSDADAGGSAEEFAATSTLTRTPLHTITRPPTRTPTRTPTPGIMALPSVLPSPTTTNTRKATSTPTTASTSTSTSTTEWWPSLTATAAVARISATPTIIPTELSIQTPTLRPTATTIPTSSPTSSPTLDPPTPTWTPNPPTYTPTVSITPTETSSPTPTHAATLTATATDTETTASPLATPTPSPTSISPPSPLATPPLP